MKKNSNGSNAARRTGTSKAKAPASKGRSYSPNTDFFAKVPEMDLLTILTRVGILAIPALVALISGMALKNDVGAFFTWWLMFYLYSWAAFPIVAWFFRGFVSTGFGFSKSLGIVLTTGPVWLLSYLGIWKSFNRPMTFIAFFLLAAISWGIPKLRKSAIISIADNSNLGHIVGEEMLFILVLVFLCFCKGCWPNINGEEKFMNFAFLNSMVRYDGLPAKDPWLAGYSINYYYYGQYMFAYLTKMLGTKTGVAYTISMCSAIALPFSTAFSLGQLFIDGLRQKKDSQVAKIYLPFAGLLTAFCTIIFGNSHSFFYDEQSFGNRVLFWKIWQKLGINVGKTNEFFYPNSTRFIGHNPNLKALGLSEHGDFTIHEFPFYSFLVGDLHAHVVSMTIVLLIVAFIFVAVFRAKFPEKNADKMYRFKDFSACFVPEIKACFLPEFIFTAYLLGLAQMCNYWDFLIYFIFCSMGLLVYNARKSTYFMTFSSLLVFAFEVVGILGVYLKFGDNIFMHLILQFCVFGLSLVLTTAVPSALSRTGAGMSMLFSISSLISLTFNMHFEMISNSIGLVDRHTSLFQFMIVWLVHLLIPLALFLLVVFTQRHAYKKNPLPELPAPLELTKPHFLSNSASEPAPASTGIRRVALDPDITSEDDPDGAEIDPDNEEIDLNEDVVLTATEKSRPRIGVEVEPEDEEQDTPRLSFLFCFLDYYLARFGDFLMCKFFRKRSIIDIFMVGMAFVGLMLLLAPEIMYVRDIYGIDFQRSNTMFKFTFSGFIILSLVVGYTVFRFMAHVTRKGALSNWGLGVAIGMLILILFIPGHYSARSLEQRTGEIKSSNYDGLDGTAYLTTHTSNYSYYSYEGNLIPYQEAIDWLNANVEGSKVICEAQGLSYTDRDIVSAYTGLPTIVGWQTHEQLWHFQGIVDENGEFVSDPNKDVWKMIIWPRYEDLYTIYTSGDNAQAAELLRKYDVTYVICGSMELCEYSVINYSNFDAIGEVVFSSSDGTLLIYKIQ